MWMGQYSILQFNSNIQVSQLILHGIIRNVMLNNDGKAIILVLSSTHNIRTYISQHCNLQLYLLCILLALFSLSSVCSFARGLQHYVHEAHT